MTIGLYVKNQTEEFIGNILLEGFSLANLTKLVIIDYTRDDQILNSSSTSSSTTISMTSESHHEKFIGFAKYLRDRRKAGVALLSNGDRLFLLPPSSEPYSRLQCTLKSHSIPRLPSTPETPSSTPKQTSTPASNSLDFLSNLIDKANTVRSQVAKETGTMPTLNSVALTVLQQFEDKVRRELSELSSLAEGLPTEQYKVSYPPLEREQRYIIHDVLTDYSNLLVVDEGEGVERHMVVYREGFQPSDESMLRINPVNVIGTKKVKPKSNDFVAPPVGSLTKVNQVKRDRRTIEEVQTKPVQDRPDMTPPEKRRGEEARRGGEGEGLIKGLTTQTEGEEEEVEERERGGDASQKKKKK